MSWLRIDDRFPRHPRIAPLSDRAFRVHVTGMCYASEFLTDGHVPTPPGEEKAVRELVRRGIWAPDDAGGYVIHDWADYNPSAETIRQQRKAASERMRDWRRRRREPGS